jgi:uncharacterized membrane protein YfcA
MDWMNTLAGFGVGLLVGITGVGGGALMTPILVLLFGVAPVAAVGTDLWFSAITKMVGGAMHCRKGSVDWQVLRRLSLGSLPAALTTLFWLHATGASRMKNGLILNALGAVLLLTALAMVFKKQTHAIGQALRSTAPERSKRAQPVLTVLAGALIGCLVTLTSVGAGALGAVMLLCLYPYRMKPAVLVGTDILHAIPLALVAGTGHLLMGHVDLALLGTLLMGSIPGIVLGTQIGSRWPEHLLRSAIALVLLAVGVKLVLG